jgi:outer membrane protein assembly factor BamE (lipoprotein component of BamABCDE complex)
MRLNRFAICLVLATAVPACVSTGPNYDPGAVERLSTGMTREQVIALLGRPTTRVTLADGTQQWMWLRSRGTMLGTADARSVTLLFGADGRYVRTLSQVETQIR